MLEYQVIKEYRLPPDADWENPQFAQEDGYVLQPGEYIYDGDIEPDIMARLHQRGVIERTDNVSWHADPDELDPDDPETLVEPEPDDGEDDQ
jgi:hypothetical protein